MQTGRTFRVLGQCLVYDRDGETGGLFMLQDRAAGFGRGGNVSTAVPPLQRDASGSRPAHLGSLSNTRCQRGGKQLKGPLRLHAPASVLRFSTSRKRRERLSELVPARDAMVRAAQQ